MSFLFNIDNELITFEDLDELSAIIRKLLSDDKKRERIAFAAYKRVVDKHTYQIRMQEMIDFVFHDSIKHTV
jgi:spore maturation protein CgeB